MAAEKKLCSQMLAATEIARSRGLINGEQLTCPFVQNCLNEVCYYADMVPEDGQMMAENDSDYFDMVGRFFAKLIRGAQKNGLWNKLDETERDELAKKYMQDDGSQTIFDRSRFNGQT